MQRSGLHDNQQELKMKPDRGRDILLQLLQQITAFLERKEMLSSRVAASKEWRKSRSKRSDSNLFDVVLQVCEQRMKRLKRTSSFQLSAQSPRELVAEAIVQELLVSLMELRMKEKETLVMDEVENVEIMRQLHVHLQKDEEKVRDQVCVGAGDEQQLEELQLMLRTDFLEEVRGADSPQKQQQADTAANNEASLQFAWETIDDQKKEIIRLRAENEELKRSTAKSEATASCKDSLFDDEPARALSLLRSQLSSRHEKNLDVLQGHIQRLEKALQSAARKKSRGWDGSRSTISSSRSTDRNEWSTLSRSAIGTEFSRTQVPRRTCDECRKSSASLLALRSEVKQLRAHAATDEESLLQAERDRGQLQRENAVLSSSLLSAKQKQEELRQLILELTQEKHQLQNLNDSEQRTSERTVQHLKEQLTALQEQKAHQKRKFDELAVKYDAEMEIKRTEHEELEKDRKRLAKSVSELQADVATLREAARQYEESIGAKDSAVKELQARLESKAEGNDSRSKQLEEDKRKLLGENERLLQTLDECKRKNQRLEKGFEELKQGKELLTSLQKVERGASALQLSELQQAREQMSALKLQLSATQAECAQLQQALADARKLNDQLTEASDFAKDDAKKMAHELHALQQDRKRLEEKLRSQQTLEAELTQADSGQKERITALSQEVTESKTAMLMWMNKYNTVSEAKKTLESSVHDMSEKQFALQRQVEELRADRDAVVLAKGVENQARLESEMELQETIASLKEQHHAMERERRLVEQEKKSLVKLVQTLQARPELQQRAFREMLVSCQRGTERTFELLSERVAAATTKLKNVEERYHQLACALSSKAGKSTAPGQGRKSAAPLQAGSPQIVIQDEDFSSSASFKLAGAQPVWLEAIELEQHRTTPEPAESKADLLKRWKWRYLAQCLLTQFSTKQTAELSKKLKRLSASKGRMKQALGRLAWQKLAARVENRQLSKLLRVGTAVTRRVSKELRATKTEKYFALWKYHARLKACQLKSAESPSFSPAMTVALGNCVQLLRQFCEPSRKEQTGEKAAKVIPMSGRSGDELTGYLVEINSKVSSWKLAVDRKLVEFTERNSQLRSLQRRCSELKDLVGLNQRLIGEMERRAAGQQSIVEAAWDFATAYKALSPSARAQVFQSRDFLSASKGIVDGLDSLGMSRSVQQLSQTLGASRHASAMKQGERKPNFLSASAAPGVSAVVNSLATETKEKSRKRLNDSNIELLEDAVGSLKGAMQKQRVLQRALKDKEHSLKATKKELEKRNMQFLLLRSFLQWKCRRETGSATARQHLKNC